MAKIQKGICKNYDNCDKADNKEIQEIQGGEPFVCEECGKKLVEAKTTGTGGGKNKLLPIIIGVVVLALIGVAVSFILPKKNDPKPENSGTEIENTQDENSVVEEIKVEEVVEVAPEPIFIETITINTPVSELSLKEKAEKQLDVTSTPEATEDTIQFSSSDEKVATVSASGLITAVKAGTATITAKGEQTEASVEVKVTAPVKNYLDLGYAIYRGDIKNGKPHGNGTMEYKKSSQIVSSKDYMASPGEKVIGSFRDGKLEMGTWYQSNGNQVVVKR